MKFQNKDISIVKVDEKNKDILCKMLKLYQRELLRVKNPTRYKYLDSYFQKADHHAYFIMIKDEIAGFALINKYSVIEKGCNSIAEFYVKKNFRNKKIGTTVAGIIFGKYPGRWEVRELEICKSANKFWINVINNYTEGNYKEIFLESEKWTGPIQIFDSS